MKLSSSFGGGGKKSAPKSPSRSGAAESNDDVPRNQRRRGDDDNEGGPRRKSLRIKSDDEATLNDDCFGNDVVGKPENTVSAASARKMKIVDDVEEDAAPQRKKISIKASEESTPSIVKSMMSMDDFSLESAEPDIRKRKEIVDHEVDSSAAGVQRKKIRIMSDIPPEEIYPAEKPVTASVTDELLSERASVLHLENDASERKKIDPGKEPGREYDNEGQTHQ
jgi:hypothetical protein